MKKKGSPYILMGIITFMLLLSGCGGGGDSSNIAMNPASGTGQVALMLTDGPAAEYDQILITIQQAALLPEDGGDPVVVFDPAEPVTYDLLKLREEDDADGGALISVQDVPTGRYSKIRLEVASVVGVNAGVQTALKLSSGKIDLNPRGPFEVEAGITLAITLDIDCDKSIHISGNHKNFRPVVFVDIQRAHPDLRCPRVLQGNISALSYGEDQETVIAFEMTLPHSMIRIPILLDETSVIIDDQGNVADAQALIIDETVSVRGHVQEGGLLASMVVIGDVVHYDGIVAQAVMDDQFEITTDAGNKVIELTGGTLILWGCDQELSPDAIKPGMPARIIAKEQAGRIVAVAVLLRPHLMVGSLTAMQAAEDGYNLSVATNPSEDIVPLPAEDTETGQDNASSGTAPSNGSPLTDSAVFLPAEAPIWIKNDGFLTADQLMALVACDPRNVELAIDDITIEPPAAIKVIVLPDLVEAYATEVDTDQRLVITDAGTVHVKDGIQIIDLNEAEHGSPHPSAPLKQITTLESIEPGDTLRIYALSLCTGADANYEAALVIIVPPETETEEE